MSAVAIQGLVKGYGQTAVLAGLTLHVGAGERVAIVGMSGAGKSTLLNVVAAFDRPDAGTVTYAATNEGRTLRSVPGGGDDADAIRRRIGFVFQVTHMMEGRSSIENIELPLKLDGAPAERRAERCRALACELGLGPALLDRRPSELSGGERQRIAIARAMARDPALVLADEPTGNLDGHHADEVRCLLGAATGRGRSALLLVTHDLGLAERLCDTVKVLRDGTLHAPLSPATERKRTEREMRRHAEQLRVQIGLRGPAVIDAPTLER